MSASSTNFEDLFSQNKEVSICIRLLAPMGFEESSTLAVNVARQLVLEKNGCQVTTIGDGLRDLDKNDLDTLHKTIADSKGSILLDIRAHGKFIDEHMIKLGKNNLISTKELLTTALEHAKGKKVTVISSACDSGQFCKDSKELPENTDYLGLADGDVYVYHDTNLSRLLSQPMELTADNILKLNLTQNFDIPIGGGSIPHLCTKDRNIDLVKLLKSHSGIKFSDNEKGYIISTLSTFIPNPNKLSTIIRQIENNQIDEYSDTEMYGDALAVAYTAQQYRDTNTHSTKAASFPSNGKELLKLFKNSQNKLPITSQTFIQQKLSSQTQHTEHEVKEHGSSELGSTILRTVSYAKWKANEYFLKGNVPYALKAVPNVIDAFANYLDEDKSLPTSRRAEKAGVNLAADALIEYFWAPRGYLLAADLAGSASEFMVERADKQIAALEQTEKLDEIHKLEVLREGREILNAIAVPKKMINLVKDGVISSYDKIVHSFSSEVTPNVSEEHLFTQLAPTAKEGLEAHKNYLLYRVEKLGQQSMLASDFMKSAAWKNEIYRLQMDCGLSAEQTQLLALYMQGNQTTQRIPTKKVDKPNRELLHTSLDTVKDKIKEDLTKLPQESKIFQAVQKSTAKSLAITKIPFNTQRIDQICTEITTVTQLGSQIANLTHCPKIAKQIHAIGSGTTQYLQSVKAFSKGDPIHGVVSFGSAVCSFTGNTKAARQIQGIENGIGQGMGAMTALAMGHPILGLIGLGGAISSFLGGFFGGDDDDGLSVVSSQINQMNQNMIQGFNTILSQQIDLARGLSTQMTAQHQQTMTRFDHVDHNLGIIQQQVQYLAVQNNHIIQQMNSLSGQLSETEAHILKGLQIVHADFVRCLQSLNEGINRSFLQTNENLAVGFNHLSEQNQLLNQEMNAKMAEQVLYTRQLFRHLNSEQASQIYKLNQQAMQLQVDRKKLRDQQIKQNAAVHAQKEAELTKHADLVLLSKSPTEKSYKAKLLLALVKTDDKSLINALSEENNPFDQLNLMSEEKGKASFIHFSTHYKNMLALMKCLMEQNAVTPDDIELFKKEVDKYRDILRLCSHLATPEMIKVAFANIENSVTALGMVIEKQMTSYEQKFTAECQSRLEQALVQQEINRSRLKSSNPKEIEACLNHRKQQKLTISLFGENTIINHHQPLAYYVYPEKEGYVFPLNLEKIPTIPKEILELEALGQGWIHFKYSYDVAHHCLQYKVDFALSSGKNYPLFSISIPAKNENDIDNAWRQFNCTTVPKLVLPDSEHAELTQHHQKCLSDIRLQFNQKLEEDIISSPSLQESIAQVEFSVGLLHAKFKLLFESFYKNQDPIVHHILQCCLTEEKLKQFLLNYQGDAQHPYLYLKNAKKIYDALAKETNKALENCSLYVDNLSLSNAITLFNHALLEWLPKDKKLAYLNEEVATLPDTVKAYSLLLRGDFYVIQEKNLDAALADYREASKLHPDDNAIRAKYADVLFALGENEKACQEYTTILENIDRSLIQPNFSDIVKLNLSANKAAILLSRGDVYAAQGLHAAALSDYQFAEQILPNQPEISYKIGSSFALLDQTALAITAYQKALDLAPNHVKSLHGLAVSLVKAERNSEAFVAYQKLLSVHPRSLEYLLKCAELCPLNENRDKCLDWVQQASIHPKAITENLLLCSELYAAKKDFIAAKNMYFKIRNKDLTLDQRKRCIKLCKTFDDLREVAFNEANLLAAQRSLFTKQFSTQKSQPTQTHFIKQTGSTP